MNTEKIYDEKINPLMNQIIALCKEHDIHFIASFSLKDEDGEQLGCTSIHTASESQQLTDRYRKCAAFIRSQAAPVVAFKVAYEQELAGREG